jgi:hypothetical protein
MDAKQVMTDAELAVELVKKKLVTEGQLKAAIDFQESVGGELLDILAKLGLARREAIDEFVEKLTHGSDYESTVVKSPISVSDVSKLTVHRKLLEKVPEQIARRYGVLLFFPPRGTRAILISTNPEAPDEVIQQLQSVLGIDLQPLDLSPEDREGFLPSAPPQVAACPEPGEEKGGRPAASAPARGNDQLLKALINLLIRKNLLTTDELNVEMELLKRRNR